MSPAPGRDVFVGAQVLGGELEDLARSEGLKSHPEHDDYLTAAHVTRVPVVGYCDVSFYVHFPQGMSRSVKPCDWLLHVLENVIPAMLE